MSDSDNIIFKHGQEVRLEVPKSSSSYAPLPDVCASLTGRKVQLNRCSSVDSKSDYTASVPLAGSLVKEAIPGTVFGTDLWGFVTVSAADHWPEENKPVCVQGTVASASSQQSAGGPMKLSLYFDKDRGYFKRDHNFGSVTVNVVDTPRNMRGDLGGNHSNPTTCTDSVTGELHLRPESVRQWLEENTAHYSEDGAITHTLTVSHKAVKLPVTDLQLGRRDRGGATQSQDHRSSQY